MNTRSPPTKKTHPSQPKRIPSVGSIPPATVVKRFAPFFCKDLSKALDELMATRGGSWGEFRVEKVRENHGIFLLEVVLTGSGGGASSSRPGIWQKLCKLKPSHIIEVIF